MCLIDRLIQLHWLVASKQSKQCLITKLSCISLLFFNGLEFSSCGYLAPENCYDFMKPSVGYR
jgi:hypothetical protein